jgi:hypothetical protein
MQLCTKQLTKEDWSKWLISLQIACFEFCRFFRYCSTPKYLVWPSGPRRWIKDLRRCSSQHWLRGAQRAEEGTRAKVPWHWQRHWQYCKGLGLQKWSLAEIGDSVTLNGKDRDQAQVGKFEMLSKNGKWEVKLAKEVLANKLRTAAAAWKAG